MKTSLRLLLTLVVGCSSADSEAPADPADTAANPGADTAVVEDTAAPEDVPTSPDMIEEVVPWCEGGVAALYDPVGQTLHAFPDDRWTVAADTPTGLKVEFGDAPWLTRQPENFQAVYRDLEGIDGFGIGAPVSAWVAYSRKTSGTSSQCS